MKKIFAIALALVMVLSMASAFAYCLTDINWACATDVCENGKGSVEVIPYVKGNGCGTGNTWTPSTCAGAVNGDKVYAAIKFTVDADPDMEWWNKADLDMTVKGMKDNSLTAGAHKALNAKTFNDAFKAGALVKLVKAVPENENEFVAGEYYLVPDAAFVKAVPAADFEADAGSLFSATVKEATKAKFCVALVSENSFKSATVNGYKVELTKAGLEISKDGKKVVVGTDKDDKVVQFTVGEASWTAPYVVKTLNADGTKFYVDATTELDWTCNEYGKFLKEVMDAFKLNFGICVTEKAIKANFGWDDKVESCFSWNSDVQAVVNAECVVAIPKTGDASVLAWLF